MARTHAIALCVLAGFIACAKKEAKTDGVPDASATPVTTPPPSSTLAPPPPPVTLVLPPVRTDVEKPCTGTFVPLCFESLPGGCCGTSVTYARCGPKKKGAWECPAEMTLGARCPGSERGCIDAIKNAVDSYGR